MRLPFVFSTAGLVAVAACQPLPDVTFAPDDAGEDASVPPRSDGAPGGDPGRSSLDATTPAVDAPVDAAPVDAPITMNDDAAPDAPVALGCPGSPPLGATYCCKSTPCNGTVAACQNSCTNCENNCKVPGTICCMDGNGNYAGCFVTCAL